MESVWPRKVKGESCVCRRVWEWATVSPHAQPKRSCEHMCLGPGHLPAPRFPLARLFLSPLSSSPSWCHRPLLCGSLHAAAGRALSAPLAPRADVSLATPQPSVCGDRLQGTESQRRDGQRECGLPAAPGVCSWEATEWPTVGAPNSQVGAGQRGYHGVLIPSPQPPGEWGITKMTTALLTSGPSELGSAQQRACWHVRAEGGAWSPSCLFLF